jgi:DNA-binding PadR family transcriptional regulator
MYLDILILRSIKKKGRSGSEISESIGKNVGWRPSPGSIYPLLKKLEGSELVVFKKIRKKKLYSLSVKGKDYLKKLEEENFVHHLEQHLDIFKSLDDFESVEKLLKKAKGRD